MKQAVFYVGNIDLECTADVLVDHCVKGGVKVATCRIFPSRKAFGTASARISIDEKCTEKLLSDGFFPEVIRVRPWVFEAQSTPWITMIPLNPRAAPFSPNSRRLKILLTNAFGIMSKLGDFQHSLHQYKPDIAIITETKVTPEKASQTALTFPGYCPPVRRDRTVHGGGVAIWVKTGISFKQLDVTHNINTNNHNNHEHPSLNDQEIVWISVELQGGQRVGVCGAYRPGTCSDTDTALLDAIELILLK